MPDFGNMRFGIRSGVDRHTGNEVGGFKEDLSRLATFARPSLKEVMIYKIETFAVNRTQAERH